MSSPGSPFDPAAWGQPSSTPGPATGDRLPEPPKLRGRRRKSAGPAGRPSSGSTKTSGRRGPRGGQKKAAAGWRAGRRSPVKSIAHFTIAIALGVAAGFAGKEWVAEPFDVPSASMAPTLLEGDSIVVEKLTYLLGDPLRGQVVVFDGTGSFDAPGDPQRFYVKRVVALGGDTVRCCDADNRLLVNESPVVENYLPQDQGTPNERFRTVTVPEGEVFVLGDNRRDSSDSRFLGTVSTDAIVGRVFMRARPLDRIGVVGRD